MANGDRKNQKLIVSKKEREKKIHCSKIIKDFEETHIRTKALFVSPVSQPRTRVRFLLSYPTKGFRVTQGLEQDRNTL